MISINLEFIAQFFQANLVDIIESTYAKYHLILPKKGGIATAFSFRYFINFFQVTNGRLH